MYVLLYKFKLRAFASSSVSVCTSTIQIQYKVHPITVMYVLIYNCNSIIFEVSGIIGKKYHIHIHYILSLPPPYTL